MHEFLYVQAFTSDSSFTKNVAKLYLAFNNINLLVFEKRPFPPNFDLHLNNTSNKIYFFTKIHLCHLSFIWHVTPDAWHMTPDMWHMTPDTQ